MPSVVEELELAPARPATYVEGDELVITVTHDHIARGDRKSSYWCAVAVALRDAGFENVEVSLTVRIAEQFYRPTAELSDWIAAFDRGEPVAPERFRLQKWETPAR